VKNAIATRRKTSKRASLEAFSNDKRSTAKRLPTISAPNAAKLKSAQNEHGTLTGLADRAALDFSVVMSKGDTGAIEWCSQDDDLVIAEYEKALAEELPEQVRLMLERQLERVRSAAGKLDGILSVFGKPRS
jgi:hypothetical protein